MVTAKSPLLPSQVAHWLPSVLPVGQSPLTHTVPCSGAPTQLCRGRRMGTHTSPYPTRCSDTLLLRDARGRGLPQLRENTRGGRLWVAHSQDQGASPQCSGSCTSAALGLVWGARRRLAFSGYTALLRHPRPESANSAVTIPRGALTCCPRGRPSTAGWRPACLRARSRRLGIPLASAARPEPLREWGAAAACLLVGRTPAPRPPCTRPGPARRKSLNW